ncbi:unnamed protein product [Orchesella dallaii]|uniref:Kelch domain-containing protein 10 n=1 Tax=Orchesella dallaii TaxID=48710 RepID=A0ABP1QLY6_9HEXA
MVLVTMKRANDQESPCIGRSQTKYSKAPRSQHSQESISNDPNTFYFKPLVFQELKNQQVCPSTTAQVPEPRSGHRIVCDDANLYSFGGYLEVNTDVRLPTDILQGRHTQRLFKELWCYNFAEGQWKYLPTAGKAPKEVASHSAILYGNFLIVFGGTGVPFGGSSSNKMNICDLRSLTWRTINTTGEAPTPQYGQSVVLDSTTRSFYVIGGTTGYGYSMDIYKLDLAKRHWEKIFVSRGDSLEPQPRYRHEVAFDGDNIYILGGGTARDAYELKTVPVFNLKDREWYMLKTKGSLSGVLNSTPRFPCPRKCQGSVQKGEDVFICGGYDSKYIFMDLWKLHLPSMQWHVLPVTMPMPLYFHSTSITSGGCMYIFGGVTHIINSTRTNRVFKIWLAVPKLKEMCWEALLYYRKDIRQRSRTYLLNTGIPSEFVNRVHPAPPGGQPELGVEEKWDSDIILMDDNEN